jgi:hypothetical protein
MLIMIKKNNDDNTEYKSRMLIMTINNDNTETFVTCSSRMVSTDFLSIFYFYFYFIIQR